jgi:hypothetical protein
MLTGALGLSNELRKSAKLAGPSCASSLRQSPARLHADKVDGGLPQFFDLANPNYIALSVEFLTLSRDGTQPATR